MKPKTIGEILREEREKRHFSLDELAKKSRIRKEYLLALENNEFSKLPAAIFVKGYIKTYAKFFSFEHKPLIALLRRDFKESAKGTLVPREFLRTVYRRNPRLTSIKAILVVLSIVFTSLIGYVGVQWYNLNKPPELTLSQPEQNQVVGPNITVVGATEPDNLVSVNSQPVALQPDGSFETDLTFVTEGIVSVVVKVTDSRDKTTTVSRQIMVQF